MGAPYNRNAILGSMRAVMANEAAAAKEPKGESADNPTTAEGEESSENAETPTGGSEGGEEGADDKGGEGSGSEESETEDGTAEGEEGNPPEEQASEDEESEDEEGEGDDPKPAKDEDDKSGKWEAEEQKDLETWGLKDIKPTAENRKILKIARDNNKAAQEAKQEVAKSNDYLAAVGNALVNHDIDNLNAMIEELGGEKLPFDVRTEEKQIEEIANNFNAWFDALKGGLTKEEFDKVQGVLAPLHKKTTQEIAKLERKIDRRLLKDETVKELGAVPNKGKYLDGLKQEADRNFDLLFKDDKKAKDYMAILQPIFKSGMVLQNPSKAYAKAPKVINELGEALYFKRNFEKEFYPELKKKIEAELKLKRMGKPPPSGKSGDSQGTPAKKAPDPNRKFNHFAGNRLLARHGNGRR